MTKAAWATLDMETSAGVEYIEVASASDASRIDEVHSISFIALAAVIGGVRLIDNVYLDPETGRVDRGIWLPKPSILYGGD